MAISPILNLQGNEKYLTSRHTRPDTGVPWCSTPPKKGVDFFLLVVVKFSSSWLQIFPPRGCKIEVSGKTDIDPR